MFQTREQTCDLTAMNLQTPSQSIDLTCQMTFICGTVTIDGSAVSITTEQIFLDDSATIQNVAPPKAANGYDGVILGENGGHGDDGARAFDMSLTANSLMAESSATITFISQGGDGGNGGLGAKGRPSGNVNSFNLNDAEAVTHHGILV